MLVNSDEFYPKVDNSSPKNCVTGYSDWDQTDMVSKHKCLGIYSKNLGLVTHQLDQ